MTLRSGGCLCGNIRFEVTGAPLRSFCCHCSMCKKASGGPMMALFFAPRINVHVTRGKTQRYRSSETAVRHFCVDCGSPIFFERLTRPERLGVFVGSLDDPSEFKPDYHIWTSRQCSWLRLDGDDDVPRTSEGPPPA